MKWRRQTTILILVLISLVSAVSAFQIIISNEGVNHTQAKELVYSIPEEYYQYVDVIEFVNETFSVTYGSYAFTYWNGNHDCYNSKIWIYWVFPLRSTLIHEIGHIWELCTEKKDYTTEEFANGFKIKK